MAGPFDLTGQNIENTYPRILQTPDGVNVYDGTGSAFTVTAVINTSSLVTTSSFNAFTASINIFTSSYNTGSFSGSFSGSLNGTTTTASYYKETDPVFVAKSASLATTGSNIFAGNQTISGGLFVYNTVTNNNSLDTLYRNLISSDGVVSVDWGGRRLIGNNGFETVKWDEYALADSSRKNSVDWGDRQILDSNEIASINWENKQLLQSDGTTAAINYQTDNEITIIGDLLPGDPITNNTSSWSLGSPTSAWKDLYVSNGSVTFISGSTQASIKLDSNNNIIFTGASVTLPTSSIVTTAQTASYLNNLNQNLTLSGSLTILNNLTVFGTQSVVYITSSQLDISTNIITVNTSTPAVRFGGLAVRDSGSLATGRTGSLLWDSQNDVWIYSNPSGAAYDGGMLLTGPRNTSGLGNEVGITTNYLSKGNGSHHMTSSQISDDGITVTIPGDLSVTSGITGSLLGTASWATNAQTSSNGFPYTGSAVITGSLIVSGGFIVRNSTNGNKAIDSALSNLYYSDGDVSVGWADSQLRDTNNTVSINWNERTLFANDNDTVHLRWDNPVYMTMPSVNDAPITKVLGIDSNNRVYVTASTAFGGGISGQTTVGTNLITQPNPSAIRYIRINADNSISQLTTAQLQTDLGMPVTVVKTTNTVTAAGNAGTASQDIPELSFNAVAGALYEVKMVCLYDTTNTATGNKWAISSSVAASVVTYHTRTIPTAGVNGYANGVSSATTYDGTSLTGTSAFNINGLMILEGFISLPTNGVINGRFATETAVTSTNCKSGSFIQYRQIS